VEIRVYKILSNKSNLEREYIISISLATGRILTFLLEERKIAGGKSWQAMLRSFRAVRSDDRILYHCRQGHIDIVRKLFTNGISSPLDVNHHGFSLIRVTLSGLAICWTSDATYRARTSRQTTLLDFLLCTGADPSREAIGLELAGPSPQSQYTQDHSRPVILGFVAITIISIFRRFMQCATPRNVEEHLWYYLCFVPDDITIPHINKSRQLDVPPPVKLLYGRDPFFVPVPGSFGPINPEQGDSTDNGYSNILDEIESQDSFGSSQLFIAEESNVGEQTATPLPLQLQTADTAVKLHPPEQDLPTYTSCKSLY
jgi:hypothetical protein